MWELDHKEGWAPKNWCFWTVVLEKTLRSLLQHHSSKALIQHSAFFTVQIHFQGKPFNITAIQAYAPTSNAEEAEVEQFYEDLQDLLELTPPKICPFHYRGLECKSRKSKITWSNRQIWPWSTKRSRSKANGALPREGTGHSKHPLPTHKRRLYTWTSPDGQHRNQTDYILCS